MARSIRSSKYDVDKRGSISVEVIERAWAMLREVEPTVPAAVLTFVDGRSRCRVRGMFSNSVWRKRRGAAHEIAINPTLIRKPAELLATMVHEAAHATLHDRGKQGGMGSTPYYHSTIFRDQCVRFGLDCGFLNTRYGWTVTEWPPSGVPDRFKRIVAFLKRTLPAGIGGTSNRRMRPRKLPVSGHTLLACDCNEGTRTIYVKKSVLLEGGIECMFCRKPFAPVT